jgi:hypothetical protein
MNRSILSHPWMNRILAQHNRTNQCPILNIYLSFSYDIHQIWRELTTNIFIQQYEKDSFMEIYAKSRRTYIGFSRLHAQWRIKKAKQTITTDLYMNEIDRTHQNSMMIHQNNTNYWFSLSDLLNQIETALLNSPCYFAEPLYPKNPYTNIPFTKSILYNIYFKVKNSTFLPSMVFHGFFLSDFDLYRFRIDNESTLREMSIRKHIHNSEPDQLFNEIMSMCRVFRLRVNPEVPRPDLIKIMRPYFYLYMVSSYHIHGLEKSSTARALLARQMRELRKYNPCFGRRCLYRIKNKIHATFTLEHPKFSMNDAYLV